jgi:dihydroorotase
MAGVFRALLLCSDGDCAEVFEAYGSLEDLEALACDCGCSLELLEASEVVDESPGRGFDLVPVE